MNHKIKKNDLKNLIKECIIEVLSEGLGTHVNLMESRPVQRKQQVPQQKSRQPINNNLRSVVDSVAGGNSVMSEILADTATSTLQRQLQADRPTSMSSVQNKQIFEEEINDDVSKLHENFGDSVNMWEKLAFDIPKSRA